MKLLTEEVLKEFRQVGDQSEKLDPIVVCKFFNPTGAGTWFATEYDEATQIFFGFVSIFHDDCDEWGSFSLHELENFKGRFGLGIERDLWFKPTKFSEVAKLYKLKHYA